MHNFTRSVPSGYSRRAVVAVQVAVALPALVAFAVLAVDVGHLCAVKGELQNAADAAALAGAAAMVTVDGVDPQAGASAASRQLTAHPVLGNGMRPAAGDIRIGRYDDPLDPNAVFVPAFDSTANTVSVTAGRRTADGQGVGLFFAAIFGLYEATLTAHAEASRVFVTTADVVPIALRTPDFGPVDPAIAAANPGKDGPSYPANGEYFENGEEVVVFLFGKGPRSPVHLVLDLPEFNGVAETNKMLSGEMAPASVMIADEMPIWNEGTGDGNFGVKLADRLQNDDPADDTIVMPVVDTLESPQNSRDEDGRLSGDIRIADYVGVRLLRVDEVTVPNPTKPSKTLTIERLVGVVVPVTVHKGASTGELERYAQSVVSLQLVR